MSGFKTTPEKKLPNLDSNSSAKFRKPNPVSGDPSASVSLTPSTQKRSLAASFDTAIIAQSFGSDDPSFKCWEACLSKTANELAVDAETHAKVKNTLQFAVTLFLKGLSSNETLKDQTLKSTSTGVRNFTGIWGFPKERIRCAMRSAVRPQSWAPQRDWICGLSQRSPEFG